MSTLAVAARPPLSPLRIAGFATALALHLAAFGLLVLPPSMMFTAVEEKPAEIKIEFVTVEKPRPPIPVPPMPVPPVRPTPVRTVTPQLDPVVHAPSDWQIAAPVADPVPQPLGQPVLDPAPTLTTAAAIAYADVPPPPYPVMARRKNLQGEVLLRVRVDESGKPIAVEVEKTSGHRILDRAALEHVLKRWRFQPALLEGRPVQAWALVPLNFRIEAG